MSNQFSVTETFIQNDDLLCVSLGFVSQENPLDILHIVSGVYLSETTPKPLEDCLYFERTDQRLSCSGEAISIEIGDLMIRIRFTELGARSLGFSKMVEFYFAGKSDLFDSVVQILDKMSAIGHREIVRKLQ